jgi:hypothetical protein
VTATIHESLHAALVNDGFAFVHGGDTRALVEPFGSLADWDDFGESWNRLELDTYMADGGRYRRRRHAVFTAPRQGAIVREPHQPHYQTLDYNPLHGGVERWFEPVETGVAGSAALGTLLAFCRALFGALSSGVPSWRVEVHQFRIEARSGEQGRPTPEGLHRDGVDYVLVLLVHRRNIASGVTTVHSAAGELGHFTLTEPFDAALVDDRRVAHGVTPVEAIDPALPAYRDVLVVTFKSLVALDSGNHAGR